MAMNKNETISSENFGKFSGRSCILGIDEAGRGPVLGPMVYAAGICFAEKGELKNLGVADSKTLTDEKREEIFAKMQTEPYSDYFSFVLEILCPHFISISMLRRSKYNLNEISHDAAMHLITLCLENGIIVEKVYVDTVGPPEVYQRRLEEKFPKIEFHVSKKADSLFPIVSAASICAKVTRDRRINGWVDSVDKDNDDLGIGSGYPADPATKLFLEKSMDHVFGYQNLVRFSWSTTRDIMEKSCCKVFWEDEETLKANGVKSRSLFSYFERQGTKNVSDPRHVFFEEMKLRSLGDSFLSN